MITIHQRPNYAVCAPSGELDASNADRFRAALDIICDEPVAVVDLAEVTFIDSAALGAIIGAMRKVNDANGQIAIACDRPSLLKVFRTVQLDRILIIDPDITSAVATLTNQPVQPQDPRT